MNLVNNSFTRNITRSYRITEFFRFFMFIIMLTTFCGCEDKVGCDNDITADEFWDTWIHGFFLSYCTGCHSSGTTNRFGAPEGVDFDSQDDVYFWLDRIDIRVVQEESMPPGGGVLEEDIERFQLWLECH